jgi:hypothetical protein
MPEGSSSPDAGLSVGAADCSARCLKFRAQCADFLVVGQWMPPFYLRVLAPAQMTVASVVNNL